MRSVLILGPILIHIYTSPVLARLSDIRTGWGIETNGRFKVERLPASAGQPATLTPLSPMYGTRPCCLV